MAGTAVYKEWIPDDIYLPTFSITAEEIFANEILLFDVNFFSPKPPEVLEDPENPGNPQVIHSTAEELQGMVSTWYFILRNIALLVLMLLLIYSGIKIVIGSTAGEKAKHKERLMDWFVAVCLIFIMHYVMAFSVQLVEKITEIIRSGNTNGNVVYLELTPEQHESAEDVIFNDDAPDQITKLGELLIPGEDPVDVPTLVWKTDLAGLFRIQAQLVKEGTSKWVGFSLCYVVLVIFTLFFAFTYIKRIIYMAFLTMIAPLVAMTYPIDKITDGKAQAFNAWLKEYIFNLMIQPLHLLLYTILVSSSFVLATSSPVYALVAVGFIMPAEKLMRKFFGFEKAKTPGLLGGAAGAAIAMTGLKSILKPRPGGGEGKGSGSGNSKDTNKVRFTNKNQGNVMDDITGEKITARGTTTKGNIVGAAASNATASKSDEERNDASSEERENTSNEAGGNAGRSMSSSIIGTNSEPNTNDSENTESELDNDLGLDEDDILANTTLGAEDWDHDGFGSANLGAMPDNIDGVVNDREQPQLTNARNTFKPQTTDVGNTFRPQATNTGNTSKTQATNTGNTSKTQATNTGNTFRSQASNNRYTSQPQDSNSEYTFENLMFSNYENRPENPERNEATPTPRKRSKIIRIIGAIGSASGVVLKQSGKELGRQAVGVLTGIHPLKLAGRIAAGATTATAGLLLGVASGDPTKAFQYTTAGAMAGNAFAGALSRGNAIDTAKASEAAKMSYRGTEYKEIEIENEKKQFLKSEENITYIRQVMGVNYKDAKDILQSTGEECFDKGITDIQDIATIHQLTHTKDESEKMTIEKAVAARTYAKRRLGGVDPDQMAEDKVQEHKKRWAKEFKATYQVDDKKAKVLAEQTFNAAIRFNKTYSGLTKVEKRNNGGKL